MLSPEVARDRLVGLAGLRAATLPPGPAGVRALLRERRCIQLDPLDCIGTNADLVALARVDGIRRGDVSRHLFPGSAFIHFAKERCLLPAEAFPHYRDQAAETPWWRLSERLERLPAQVLDHVLAEVRARGPVSAAELADHGPVEALDWSGWKGTGRATTMALEVLWTRCQVVAAGQRGQARLWDVPDRALPRVAAIRPQEPFGRWALLERVEAAGFLSLAGGPWWSMLHEVRTSDLPLDLVREGRLHLVQVGRSRRTYLAPADLMDRTFPEDDGRLRILGPLDPLLWDRRLVHVVFGFDYAWEVYKPAAARRWGWYVCPLLHRGHLVGRLEARMVGDDLVVERLWPEEGPVLDPEALALALERHRAACAGGRPGVVRRG